MDFNKLTIKIAGGRRRRAGAGAPRRQPGADARPPDVALLDQELPRTLVERAGADAGSLRAEAEARLAQQPSVSGGDAQPQASRPRSASVLDDAFDEARALDDEFVSVEHLLLALDARPARGAARRAQGGARRPAGDDAGSRGHVPGAREVRPRPHRARRAGQARPGDRPRRGDPPHDPGALAPHEEQPRADRRAGRRQDGDRRGARAADRRGRRARGPEGQARLGARRRRARRRREVPRRVRGAAEGRARRRSPRAEGEIVLFIDELHTIVGAGAAEGAVSAGEPAEADARARRAARGRRDDARRVPQAHREGRRARAPLPAGASSASRPSPTRSRSCAASRSATRRTTASASATPRSSPRRCSPTATSPTASCPTRRSTSSTRPPRACGWRSTPRPSSSTRPSGA